MKPMSRSSVCIQTEEEFFGRQPKPVTVTFTGEAEDIRYWISKLERVTRHDGWSASLTIETNDTIKIYPRAVND
jgi:hypothetical protein